MIDRIRGVVVEKTPASVSLSVGGITFNIAAPLTTVEKLPGMGETTELRIHLMVREDVIELYGFHDEDDRWMFRQLKKVSGVGPKTALAVLSRFGRADLIQIVTDGDVRRMTTVPGIGRKTAERLIVELKDMAASKAGAASFVATAQPSSVMEAVRALEVLGFPVAKADEAVRSARAKLGEEATVEALVKQALKGG